MSMRNTRNFWKAALAVLFVHAVAMAQGTVSSTNPIIWGADQIWNLFQPPFPLNYTPGQVEQYWKCVGGYWVMYRYYKTYPGVHGFTEETGTFPTLFPCDPKESTNPQGGPAPNANSNSGVPYDVNNTAQGPPPPLGGASGSVAAALARLRDRSGSRRAATPAPAPAAIALTLPYRELPLIPFTPDPSPTITTSCASQLNPTGFAVDHINSTVTRYAICNSQPIAVVHVTGNPLQVRVTPDGSQAIVTSYDNGITFIDTSSNQITKVIQTGPDVFPSGVVIAPDGSYALVTSYIDVNPALLVLDVQSQSIAGSIPLDTQYPQSVFLNPDATLAWVTYPWDNAVEVIDILTGLVVENLVVINPFDVAFNPTGTVAYVASGAGSVQMIDTASYRTTQSVPADLGACDLSVSLDGHTVTVNNYLAGTITSFDPRLAPFSVTVSAGASPRGAVTVPLQ